MSSIVRKMQRENKRDLERKEMKQKYGKRAKLKCSHCGKYTLFRKDKTLKDKDKIVCVRCGK